MQQQIKLEELVHSPNNVRKVKSSKDSIDQLKASIQSKGMLHNLVVVQGDNSYEVIDGNRRLEALKELYQDTDLVSCIVLDSDDGEVGLHANMMREDMHPLDECDVIQALVADGTEDYDSVAVRFGRTDKWVKQRVSLSELSDTARALFRDSKINLSVAQAFTLGTAEKQDKYCEEFDPPFNADGVKRHMLDSKISTENCLFEITPKIRDDLQIESDLFSNQEFITNREKFDEYQEAYILDLIALYTQEYFDVVYLKDEYYYSSPACRGLEPVRSWDDTERPKADLIMVVTYNTYTYKLEEMHLIPSAIKEVEDAAKEPEAEVEEVTPLTMSKPQKDLVKGYYTDYVKSQMWDDYKEGDKGITRFFKSLLCHRALGYSYSTINRVGHLYAEAQAPFPKDEFPDDYTVPVYEQIISDHKENALTAFNDSGTSPMSYFMSLEAEELDDFFMACCITAISRHDMLTDVVQENIFNYTPAGHHWFKPDSTWVNKWNADQLSMVEDFLFGKVSNASRTARTKAISKELGENPVFNPFGTWPQYK